MLAWSQWAPSLPLGIVWAPWNIFWEAKGGRINLLLEDLDPLSQDISAAHHETQLSQACSVLHGT